MLLARLAGLEPATLGLEGRCSVQLSYRRFSLRYQPRLTLLIRILTYHGRGRGI
jgi:hypothetical protein